MKVQDIFEIDFLLLCAAITLTVFGVLFIYSSGLSSSGAQGSTEHFKQILWGASGLSFALVLSMIDYRRLFRLSFYLYLGTLGLLVYTCIFGHTVNGAKAWIGIGSFGIQPSEFTKITTILFLARYLDASKRKADSFIRFLTACLIVFIPMALVLIQPDFGTSLVFIPMLLVMTFIAGISIKYTIFLMAFIGLTGIFMILPLWQGYLFEKALPSLMMITNLRFIGITALALFLIGVIAMAGFLLYKKGYFFWIVYGVGIVIFSLGASYMSHKVLKDYQIMRLIVFLNPEVDPRGAGWNIIQSITAIGSGGFWGKGYLGGTHSHYRFLPQQSTDFIFSIFSEEWGFIGGILVFILFLLICLRLVRIMKTAADPFGTYITAGLAAMYSFHFLINVGMTMGIMPITGIPLLFMSYGGSALISAMAGIGLALSIYIRRFIR
ncbi:MAG: rod shape-determining protein RodA [Treponema sp.]|jgi:rod shape determining protein RodA|nr:rod shape-determining protein RodA [Treponema sp.]